MVLRMSAVSVAPMQIPVELKTGGSRDRRHRGPARYTHANKPHNTSRFFFLWLLGSVSGLAAATTGPSRRGRTGTG